MYGNGTNKYCADSARKLATEMQSYMQCVTMYSNGATLEQTP